MRTAFRALAPALLLTAIVACSPSAGSSAGVPSAPPASASVGGASPREVSSMPASPSPTASPASPSASAIAPFSLTSSAFADGGAIPRGLTCDGADTSPPLAWTGVPAGAATLVLLVDDPDARDFVHWIVLDVPAADAGFQAGISPTARTPQQGTNGFGQLGWGGPCPPSGTHHYRFTLTALSAPLGLDGHPDGAGVRTALSRAKATVLGTATLTGTYRRG